MAEINSPPSVDWSIESTAGSAPRGHEGPIAHEGMSIKSRLMRIFCCGAK